LRRSEEVARDDAALEPALVALAMHGDSEAFAKLVHRRQSALRNLLRRLCRDPALADDLAQQAFLQAWRALPSLRSTAAFAGWLRRLAINAFLAHARSRHVEVALEEAHETVGRNPTIGLAIDLDRALATLVPAERLCIVLAYTEGMSHTEISAETDIPLGTVKSHIHRGTARLRAYLDAYRRPEDHANAG
jgi:RNA polymerase sigma-70 factor (ECF subfamily)